MVHQSFRPIVKTQLTCLLTVLLVLWLPSVVTAQEGEGVTLREVQLSLNNQAIQAMQQDPPDPAAAIRLAEAALVSGPEANVLLLTLGRAHQLAGNCGEALAVFERVDQAPDVVGVRRDQVRGRLLAYRTEIEEGCEGTLVVRCRDGETELSAEGIPLLTCDTPLQLMPGRYEIEARLMDISTQVETAVTGGRQTELSVGLGGPQWRATQAVDQAARQVERAVLTAINAAERALAQLESEADRSVSDPAIALPTPVELAETKEDEGSHRLHLVVAPLFGGYAVQAIDGAANGGLLYGGDLEVSYGVGLTSFLGVEALLGADVGFSYPLNIKFIERYEEEMQIGLTTWSVTGELRTWFEFLGVGLFLNHRTHFLHFFSRRQSNEAMVFGPTVSLSGSALARQDGYLEFRARWGLLIDGGLSNLSFSLKYGAGLANVGLEYTTMAASSDINEPLRRGELLFLTLGFRVPGLPRGGSK